MAWPPDVADGGIIAASHINAIKNSVQTWQGDVNAQSYRVSNLGQMAMSLGSLGNSMGAQFDASILTASSPNIDRLRVSIVRDSTSSTSSTASWRIVRIIDDVAVWSEIAFLEQGMAIYAPAFKLTALKGSAPAAGSKELWYDPADGNRVKFAP